MKRLYPWIEIKAGNVGANKWAMIYFASFFLLIGGWFYFSFLQPPRYDEGFVQLEGTAHPTATRVRVDGSLGSILQISTEVVPTQYLITSIPRPSLTPTATITPSPTVDTWMMTYVAAQSTRDSIYTNLGVIAPARACPEDCTPIPYVVGTLPAPPPTTWYETLSPDFTPAIVLTHTMDMTIQAFIEASATAQAQERSEERFSDERAPHAPRPVATRQVDP